MGPVTSPEATQAVNPTDSNPAVELTETIVWRLDQAQRTIGDAVRNIDASCAILGRARDDIDELRRAARGLRRAKFDPLATRIRLWDVQQLAAGVDERITLCQDELGIAGDQLNVAAGQLAATGQGIDELEGTANHQPDASERLRSRTTNLAMVADAARTGLAEVTKQLDVALSALRDLRDPPEYASPGRLAAWLDEAGVRVADEVAEAQHELGEPPQAGRVRPGATPRAAHWPADLKATANAGLNPTPAVPATPTSPPTAAPSTDRPVTRHNPSPDRTPPLSR